MLSILDLHSNTTFMEFVFLLEEGERVAFLHQLMNSLGCTYICLWSYLPQPCNYFISLDGLFNGENNVARRLFEEYRHSAPLANDGHVPGFAFRNNLPHLELQFEDLQTLVSNPVQLQFYREAGIKKSILMGCSTGEIELGMSTNPQVNMEMEMEMMRMLSQEPIIAPSKPASSSSTSLRSLSMESPSEYTSFIFNAPIPSNVPSSDPRPPVPQASGGVDHALSLMGPTQFPFSSLQSEEEDAMARAYLAVISSSPSSSSSSWQARESAFRRYRRTPPRAAIIRRVQGNMMRKCVTFYRNLYLLSRRGFIHGGGSAAIGGPTPSTTQVHHVISERRRRGKINESFKELRFLLPPGSKKDKASVLSNTAEYLASLKAQVEELTKKNQILEAQLLPPPPKEEGGASSSSAAGGGGGGGGGRVDVRITNVVEESNTSEDANNNRRFVDVHVSVRGELSNFSMSDLVIRLLEFLKGVQNLGLMSVQANIITVQSSSVIIHRLILRLRIHEVGEWDESSFQEAVKRIVDDLA